MLNRIRALALLQANRVRARPPGLVDAAEDARNMETFEATARLIELIERDADHLQRICVSLVQKERG